ncbi:MAG: hypothetical protein WC635_01645 [Bacteriovorax sp.]|jgi:hypothetical protein
MNFETEYKNIIFNITLESIQIADVSLLLGDKFNRLPNQTMIELKNGNLIAYNLIIKSTKNSEVRVHYWSNILLPKAADDLFLELGYFLEDEEILDAVVSNWELSGDEFGPAWK